MSALEVRGVTVSFGGRAALRAVDLVAEAGTVTGLIGPNGAGKTTLLRTLATVTPPQAGTVTVAGHDVGTARGTQAARRQIGFLPQDFRYLPSFTVREFVSYCAWLRGVPRRSLPGPVNDAIEAVGLTEAARLRLRQLSGGMLRRCGIAQAIVGDPDVVLLDEPTAGLDPLQRVEFRALIRRLGTSAAVIISTHLVEDVAAACDRVHVLADGRLRFSGTPDELSAAAAPDAVGDSPMERGYATVLGRSVAA